MPELGLAPVPEAAAETPYTADQRGPEAAQAEMVRVPEPALEREELAAAQAKVREEEALHSKKMTRLDLPMED